MPRRRCSGEPTRNRPPRTERLTAQVRLGLLVQQQYPPACAPASSAVATRRPARLPPRSHRCRPCRPSLASAGLEPGPECYYRVATSLALAARRRGRRLPSRSRTACGPRSGNARWSRRTGQLPRCARAGGEAGHDSLHAEIRHDPDDLPQEIDHGRDVVKFHPAAEFARSRRRSARPASAPAPTTSGRGSARRTQAAGPS